MDILPEPPTGHWQPIQSAKKNLGQALRALPLEILGNIFLHSVTEGQRPSSTEPPLLLLQICSSWRKLALSLPRLWNDLTLDTSTIDYELPTVDKLIHMTQLWFRNARAAPLTFTLNHLDRSSWGEEAETEFTAAAMIPFANQYRHLKVFSMQISDFLQYLKLPSPGNADELESLVLFVVNPPLRDDLERLITVFEYAPKLRDVTLSISYQFIHALRLPWSQLTYLDVVGCLISPSQFHTLLKVCNLLIDGGFRIHHGGENDVIIRDTKAENLTDLSVVLNDAELDLRILFQYLELPALTSLQLECLTTPQPGEDLSHSRPRLQKLCTLSLITPHITSTTILSLLRAAPLLVDLNLHGNLGKDDFISFLDSLTNKGTERSHYVPLLETFQLDLHASPQEDFQFPETEFVEMVRSRQETSKVPYLCVILRIHLPTDFDGGQNPPIFMDEARIKREASFEVIYIRDL